ncbi:tumor necrosis factor ligand superfamily member 13B [Bombina bombina]|uniref:tumor necrosis factor ligand superfamily member 13B n=1 Tax=Bombina bombina TaxID=8345 RepID=UPI00235AC091|nr:tumor necrosis factor ligand superfamily member 13B [Bombina bombina]
MDSDMTSRNCFPPVAQQKRILYYYQKDIFSNVFLPFTIILCSSIAVASFYNLILLKAEIASLRTELQSYKSLAGRQHDDPLIFNDGSNRENSDTYIVQKEREKTSNQQLERKHVENVFIKKRSRRFVAGGEGQVFHSCLQLIADSKNTVLEKDDETSIIPWLLSFKRGSSLEEKQNKILIKESGYFFVYGQVWYTDEVFAMGHLIQRKKAQNVGDDPNLVTLFRCIQNMPLDYPNNTCYTAGIAKLEEGDELHLTIPRSKAKISLKGEGTFFGAIRLY